MLLVCGACSTGTDTQFSLWEASLEPIPPSTISGDAAGVTQFGRSEISLGIREGAPGALYGWRINSGDCQTEGVLQGGVAAYPLLEADEAGRASGDALLSSKFRPGNSYAVRVYQSDQSGSQGEVLACGVLEEITSSSG